MSTSIGTIRLLLSVIVIGFHSGYQLAGPFAVICFYVISGYVSTHALISKYSPIKFVQHRVRSLLPTYLLASLLVFTSIKIFKKDSEGSTVPELIRDFIDGTIPTLGFGSVYLNFEVMFVPAFWTVFVELSMYVILALAFSFFTSKKITKVLLMTILTSITFLIWIERNYPNDLGILNRLWYFNLLGALGYFAVGSATYFFCRAQQKSLTNWPITLVRFLKLAILSVLLFLLVVYPLILRSPESTPTQSSSLNWYLFSLWVTVFSIFFVLLDYMEIHSNSQRSESSEMMTRSRRDGRWAYRIYVYQCVPQTLFQFREFEWLTQSREAKFFSTTLMIGMIIFCVQLGSQCLSKLRASDEVN